jgi:hypothetical protein
MLSAGHKAIAIPSATLLKPKDVELLKSLSPYPSPKGRGEIKASPFGRGEKETSHPPLGGQGGSGSALSFHMYPDRDEPGERLFLQLQQILPQLEHHQLPVGCKDFSEYYLSTKRKEGGNVKD